MVKQESAEYHYGLNLPGGNISLDCKLLLSGNSTFEHAMQFDHPHPAFNRIFLFRKGGCKITTRNRSYRMKAGVLYLLPVDFSFQVHYDKNASFIFVHLNCLSPEGLDIFRKTATILSLNNDSLRQQIEKSYHNSSLASVIQWQNAIWQAVTLWAEPHFASLAAESNAAPRYRTVLEYIRKNLSPDIRLTELAKMQHCSVSALSKGFYRAYGISLKKFIIHELMKKGRHLLMETDKPVGEIARTLGYQDQFYFQRIFHREVNITPLKYRQSYRREKELYSNQKKQ